MNRIPRILIAMAASAALGLQAAAQAQPDPAEAPPPQEFVIGLGDYRLELNPYKSIYAHEMQMFTAIYEGLFTYDPQSLDPVRAQAESYAKSADGRTWTFTIREDARWWDGSPVTAGDFVESWLYLMAPETKAEYAVFLDIIKGAKEFRAKPGRSPSTVGLRAPDDRTLVVELSSPAAYFTRLLCHSAFVPVHRSLRGKRTWASDEVIGNGPYRILSLDDGEMVMAKADTYWDAANVAIPRIRAVFLKDDAEGSRRYNDGEINWLTDSVDLDTLLIPEDIQYAPMFGTGYFFWNSGRRPWSDPRVRRALALLVPWNRIRTDEDYNSPTASLILPFAGYESPKGIRLANAKEALALLADAGFPEGKGLPAIRVVVYAGSVIDKAIGVMEEAWGAYGIKVERVEVSGYGQLRPMRQKGFDLSFTGWIGDFADPAAFLLMWTADSGLNDGGYKSREYDELIARSMLAEGAERMALLSEAEGMLLRDAVVMPVYHSLAFNVIDTGSIAGWHSNPMDIHPFKSLSFGGAKAAPNVALAGTEVRL